MSNAAQPQELRSGQVVAGSYRVSGQIAAGGMGRIYAAEHTRTGRRLVLKVLSDRFYQVEEYFKRFQREAEIAARLGHPHIVEIIDFNRTEGGLLFIAMERLDGQDLFQRLRDGPPLDLASIRHILRQVVSALSATHEVGVVHRDLKPENIFLCQREEGEVFVKLLDFGISKLRVSGSQLTKTNVAIGTPYYMSPEQAKCEHADVDARTDIFALGAIAYELLSGKKAFFAEEAVLTLFQVCFEAPATLNSQVGALPPGVSEVVSKALEKDKLKRYASVKTFWRDFQLACGGEAPKLVTGELLPVHKEFFEEPAEGGSELLESILAAGRVGSSAETVVAEVPKAAGVETIDIRSPDKAGAATPRLAQQAISARPAGRTREATVVLPAGREGRDPSAPEPTLELPVRPARSAKSAGLIRGGLVGAASALVIVAALVVGWLVWSDRTDAESGLSATSTDSRGAGAGAGEAARRVKLVFLITPAHATLYLGGRRVLTDHGKLRRVISLPPQDRSITVRVTAPDFNPAEGAVVPVQDQTLPVNLFRSIAGEAGSVSRIESRRPSRPRRKARPRLRPRRRPPTAQPPPAMPPRPASMPPDTTTVGMRELGTGADDI